MTCGPRSSVAAITVFNDAADVAEGVAQRMAEVVADARRSRGIAHISLAGGKSPQRAYELFAAWIDDWDGIHLWFGDERDVGADDSLANYRMAAAVLPAERLHRIRGEDGPTEGAASYEAELRLHVAAPYGGLPVLDLAVLGVGEDGHTASLFPGNVALGATGICAAVAHAPLPPPDRITLTLPMIRAARARLLLASGAAKAGPVAVLANRADEAAPASLVGPLATELMIDEAAAAEITTPGAGWTQRGSNRGETRLSCAIIGSFRRHYGNVLHVAELFEQRGIAVKAPVRSEVVSRDARFVRFAADDPCASDEEVQLLALHQIMSADFAFVLVVDGYVGPTTAYEIGRLIERRVPVFFSDRPNDLPIPIPEDAVVAPRVMAENAHALLASVAHVSDDDRLRQLNDDLLAGYIR